MGITIPPPFLLTLPYQSCVFERSAWRLWICGPPTQGWVTIFTASFGGDRQHGTGDGGQNVGTDGKMRFCLPSLPFDVVSITCILRERRTFNSMAGMGWSGLLGERRRGTRNQREGLKLAIYFAKNNGSRIDEQVLYVCSKMCCFGSVYKMVGIVDGWC